MIEPDSLTLTFLLLLHFSSIIEQFYHFHRLLFLSHALNHFWNGPHKLIHWTTYILHIHAFYHLCINLHKYLRYFLLIAKLHVRFFVHSKTILDKKLLYAIYKDLNKVIFTFSMKLAIHILSFIIIIVIKILFSITMLQIFAKNSIKFYLVFIIYFSASISFSRFPFTFIRISLFINLFSFSMF